MTARAIDPAGHAGFAAFAATTTIRRWRALLGALLLALTPGLASAAEPEEWPTTPDRGPQRATGIPWMRFSGDPNQPVEVLGQLGHGRQVLVVREQELTGRQRRLIRRAERHAEKAAKLRKKAGTTGVYAVVVPDVQRIQSAPTRTVVIDPRRPKVQVVRLDREHDGCDEHEDEDEVEVHAPVVLDTEQLSKDVERQVARALREAERMKARAERDAERAQRGAERGRRHGEAARRAVERAMRDGKIDAEEGRRIGEAARGG